MYEEFAMPSFDIVCEIDMQEVDNAVNQAVREIENRFDFRGGSSKIELDKQAKLIKLLADDDLKLRSMHQIIETKMAKRQIDLRALDYQDEQEAAGNAIRQNVLLKAGLSKDEAKKVTKEIKNTKLKVQAQIQDDQVRVTGKKIDDLQSVISALKGSSINLPLQFVNMRS